MVLLSGSKFPHKKKSMNGGNVTDNGFEPWEEETNRVIAKDLIENVEKLLCGKAHYLECSDRTTYHKKIVIEYDLENK